jgi:hypothetical protein
MLTRSGISRRTFHKLLMLASAGKLLSRPPTLLLAQSSSPALQPLSAAVDRLLHALQSVGSPVSTAEQASISTAQSSAEIERILDNHVLLEARINPEGRVSVSRGQAKAELVEHGWRTFLVKINNEAAITSSFKIYSRQGEPMGRESGEAITGVHDETNGAVDAVEANTRWLGLDNWTKPPLETPLSGLSVEYRILLLYSRDRGQREASLEAVLGDEEQDLGFRSSLAILFTCLPSQQLSLNIFDVDGAPTTASILITDKLHRVYPAQNKRILPDLWFEPHIYRSHGETITLPAGEYTLNYTRGPEYRTNSISLLLTDKAAPPLTLQLERWVSPRHLGYYSGDTHIHAAGCSHYESPSEGVTPDVMYRQVLGEALDLGDVLTWGPGYYYQKQFFSGHVEHALPHEQATLRYDVEVSGFPSSHCGHLVLLQLKEQDYPGTTSLDQWPSWNVPILAWATTQGALAGYAHSGHGLNVASTELPNYLMPPFDSMGANEYIADVTHEGLVAFISGCDTRPFAELNIWYHTLNCGYRTVFVGETDFPCLSDERVGGGRTYVKLQAPPSGDKGYANWISGITSSRSYAGDGRSHIFNFAISADAVTPSGKELLLPGPGKVTITATVCALLEAEPTPNTDRIRHTSPYDKPYWHLERARIANSRKVALELIVNGEPVQQHDFQADGSLQEITFQVQVEQSSWIALRILPSLHTNPLFVLVNGAPIRASSKSAQWCRAAVDVCWAQKSKRIRPSELPAAAAAYEHARLTYDRILSECKHT